MSDLRAPVTFRIPISFALILDLAVDKLTKFKHAINSVNNATTVKIYTDNSKMFQSTQTHSTEAFGGRGRICTKVYHSLIESIHDGKDYTCNEAISPNKEMTHYGLAS